ncbi:MAG: glutamate racemase [Alistipes sp.]|nr:glutamate racemase [Alistipes sp.]
MNCSSPIGVYDSGFGGLSVWRALYDALPGESLVYLGDGKNCPYGDRTPEEIARFADEAVERLLAEGVKMIVVACNTATAVAIKGLRERYPATPFVGLEPAVKPACLTTQTGKVGVLATARSLEGDHFRTTAAKYADRVEIIAAVGEGFVEIVENSAEKEPATLEKVRAVVEPMLAKGVDKIVLGCTHYPFLMEQIREVVGDRDVEIVDSGEAVERRVEQLLDEYGLRAEADHRAEYRFLTFASQEYAERLERKAFDR